MIGRNPLNESYYNPLGRTAQSRTDDRKRMLAITQLKTDLMKFRREGKTGEIAATEARMRQLGVSDDEIAV
jgi:hypothetical protein